MRVNDDGKTVRAMDVLVPGVGEIIGGSQREERLDVLEQRMEEQGLDPTATGGTCDLRRYGTVPHAGFGLGLERADPVHDRHGEHPRRDSVSTRAAQRELLTNLLGRGAGRARRNDPSMFRSLFRLNSFLVPTAGCSGSASSRFSFSRIFEAPFRSF